MKTIQSIDFYINRVCDVVPLMSKNILLTSGLFCLDVIRYKSESNPRIVSLGGSSGNVSTIIANFGWDVYPITRIGNDEVSELLINEMLQNGISDEFIDRDSNVATPIIIEEIHTKKDRTYKKHVFKWICRNCNNRFGSYRPITIKSVQLKLEKLKQKLIGRNVFFYFDRVSPAIREIAKFVKSLNGLTFFEPVNIKNVYQDKILLEYVDILKISKNGASHIEDIKEKNIKIIVESQGEGGIVLKEHGKLSRFSAFQSSEIVDPCGAGDWTSAGILSKISNKTDLIEDSNDVFEFSQALGFLNCHFLGPRTMLDQYSIKDILNTAHEIARYDKNQIIDINPMKYELNSILDFIPRCNRCNQLI